MTNLSGWDHIAHDAISANITYKVVIRSEPANHPKIQAFLRGFHLPCSNGFDFVIKYVVKLHM